MTIRKLQGRLHAKFGTDLKETVAVTGNRSMVKDYYISLYLKTDHQSWSASAT